MDTSDIQVMVLTAIISMNVYYEGIIVMHSHYAVILMEVGPVNRVLLVSDQTETETNVRISTNVRKGLISAQVAMLIVKIPVDHIHAIAMLGIEIPNIMVVVVAILMNVQNVVIIVKLLVKSVAIRRDLLTA